VRLASRISELVFPALLIGATALLGSFTARANEIHFLAALVDVTIVVGLYVFIGNSGVLSFGQISFVAVGAFAAGEMTISADVKRGIMPDLFPLLRDHSVGNVESLLLAAGVGAVFAFLVGLPLMRLSGLAAGIATFAVLGITHNVLFNYTKIGPGATALTNIPETTGLVQGMVGALIAITAAWLYQLSRFGRMLRATREDPAAAQAVGISIHRQRLLAFTLSGALCGFAGGLFVHQAGTITTEDVYLNLTFLTLAMLVVGGVGSLTTAESGVYILGLKIDLTDGTHLVVLGVVMALVLVVRPSGLTGGREFRLPRIRLRRQPAEAGT
jgi:branched-chain amino acid transport system permease protein